MARKKPLIPESVLPAVVGKCIEALGELEPLFNDDCKLTLVMRSEKNEECFLVLSKDDLEQVEHVLRKSRARGAEDVRSVVDTPPKES